MKAFLMHRASDFDTEADLPSNAEALIADLELDTLLATMASGDRFLFDIARQALLTSLPDPNAIVYRQQVLTDCLAHPDVVRELYELAGEALKAQRSVWGTLLRDSPRTILSTSVAKMELFVGSLRRLRAPSVRVVEIVSGTSHATPSVETSALVIVLATYRVLARSSRPAGSSPPQAGPLRPGRSRPAPRRAWTGTTAHSNCCCHRYSSSRPQYGRPRPPAPRPPPHGRRGADITGWIAHDSLLPVFRSLNSSANRVARRFWLR